jgi:predicted kinase
MRNLYLLIGIPGSGKSTYAADWASGRQQGVVVSTDAIRAALFGDASIQGSWQLVEREVERQFRYWARSSCSVARSRIVYDATNARRDQRQHMISLARNCGFTFITGIWLPVPLEVALVRNQQRDRRVPESVIVQMHHDLCEHPPQLGDGLDVLVRLWCGNHQNDVRDV